MHDVVGAGTIRGRLAGKLDAEDARGAVAGVGGGRVSEDVDGAALDLARVVDADGSVVVLLAR